MLVQLLRLVPRRVICDVVTVGCGLSSLECGDCMFALVGCSSALSACFEQNIGKAL